MESIYLIFVFILFALAITDLVVGVSNDAVNFLVSALGSRSAPFWLIMIVASAGVFLGSVSSDGMMEVARKGIFNPNMFVFSEIIIIFMAVMITDIILLDLFNTFGFPTSTTVSIVFELLGAAVGIATIKIIGDGGNVAEFINSTKAMEIIGGILLSVVVAFTVGAIIQYLARLLFSFNTKKTYKYFGGIWSGLALATITYFMFMKGLKHSTLADWSPIAWAIENKWLTVLISFGFWTVVMQTLIFTTKFNVLKVVVLAGTFALAMAFAGNDLVNFIGVPLAGFSSWEIWGASGAAADSFEMGGLSKAVKINPLFLIGAGVVMVLTLWTSKKARSVTETSINLSRQDEGQERFGSSPVSRALVRMFVGAVSITRFVVPASVARSAEKRFMKPKLSKKEAKEAPAFDLIRASVNLVVASILISIATSYKLPLSTTYVTFMVAMGTSLADRAWGRESAVYRVTGVISVIGGWFLTAFVAFTASFVVVAILFFGKTVAVVLLVALAVFLFLRTKVIHKNLSDKAEKEKTKELDSEIINDNNIFQKCTDAVSNQLELTPQILDYSLLGLEEYSRKNAKKAKKIAEELKLNSKEIKYDIYKIISILKQNFVHSAQFYIREVDYLRETSYASNFIALRIFEHIDNNHENLTDEQISELKTIKNDLKTYILKINETIKTGKFENFYPLKDVQKGILQEIELAIEKQIERAKQSDIINTKNSILYLNLLVEYKNLALFFKKIGKAHKKFIRSKEKYGKKPDITIGGAF